MSIEGFVIDQGGSDITVTMTVMNSLTSMSIQATNLVDGAIINGAITDYKIEMDSFVYLKDQDRILITNPPSIGFGPDGISCDPATPDPLGVSNVSCESIDEEAFAVTLQKVDQKKGKFEIIVHGMKNPPNFRTPQLFSDIFMQTDDYYSIQKLNEYQNTLIQTNKAASITDFKREQQSDVYGQESRYEI